MFAFAETVQRIIVFLEIDFPFIVLGIFETRRKRASKRERGSPVICYLAPQGLFIKT